MRWWPMPDADLNAIAAGFAFDTPRLHVRPLQDDDEAFYCALYTNADTQRHTGGALAPAAARRSFTAALAAPQRTPMQRLYLMLCERRERSALGMVGLNDIDASARRTEIGILMSPQARGAGYGREGFGALAAQIFQRLPIDEIYVQYATANIGADRLATGVGFRYADPPGRVSGADQRVAVMYRG